ncbi:MAG TPA: 2-amino-4-hydroxy-6-hydroxymethyldihydropteridine diphosphokinase [Actinomycetota bacterium]|nr:2-amino-4-hydroxy-6-hydroxymethyldihydropteridine diphosphokinase [Actinomycetota bacterium]
MARLAYLGLGSNLGDRLTTLQRAVELLDGEPGIHVVASSRVWETDPVGGPPQPDYLNAVVRIETELTARELLDAVHRVEAALDRVRDVRWGPRTIDVDIELFGDERVDEPDLTIPHPRMLERAFVVLPLLELDADPVLPDGRRVLDVRIDDGVARPVAPALRVGPR